MAETSKDKPWPCTLVEGRISPCWALDEVLQMPGGRGTRMQGLEIQSLINMKTLKFSRNLVVAKSGKHGKRGLVLNFCPYCRGELVANAADDLAESLASSPTAPVEGA